MNKNLPTVRLVDWFPNWRYSYSRYGLGWSLVGEAIGPVADFYIGPGSSKTLWTSTITDVNGRSISTASFGSRVYSLGWANKKFVKFIKSNGGWDHRNPLDRFVGVGHNEFREFSDNLMPDLLRQRREMHGN